MSRGAGALPGVERAGPVTLPLPLALRIGWRNLWRNGRRTALTAGGIAFAVFLVVSAMCLQFGSYEIMEETATSLLAGHLQIQNGRYAADQGFEDTLEDADVLAERIARAPGVAAVAPRVEAFVLASAGERSFGAQVLGVTADAERRVVDFPARVVRGGYLEDPGDGVIGVALARNLGVDLGDEVVLLGNARHGGVAAMVVRVGGVFQSGVAELDRSVVVADLGAAQAAFDLAGQAHRLVVRSTALAEVESTAAALRRALPGRWPDREGGAPLVVRTWREVLPELRQAIEVDRVSGSLFFIIIMVLVAFSVVNTFIMTVFERTREFGMLMAIGMRPGKILLTLQWEALLLWVIGTGAGLLAAAALVGWLRGTGIPVGADLERLATQMYMPSRIYPSYSVPAMLTAPLIMLVGTQLAAILPGLRVRRIRPVDALRVAA